MIFRRTSADSGQAFPIYITVVAGLLFLAFAYLAVGQAAVNRSDAQTAADAAALAAAQNRREYLTGKWLEILKDPTKWRDVFHGDVEVGPSCWRAYQLAAQNDGRVDECDDSRPMKVTVEVTTNKRVGKSVVPGVEDIRSSGTATAVVEPICTFDNDGDPAAEEAPLPELNCNGEVWKPNPDDPEDLPGAEDLFDVHLAAD
ncbi:pilus assembly protein TadG-related protein [Streptomyces sp. NPDC015171]|uniref:pilus assembly protein TadG-related protein n=1 Tax=Streptomyces sp. NPDC015171 TaxID=3364945 RepID=UPI0036FB2BCF